MEINLMHSGGKVGVYGGVTKLRNRWVDENMSGGVTLGF